MTAGSKIMVPSSPALSILTVCSGPSDSLTFCEALDTCTAALMDLRSSFIVTLPTGAIRSATALWASARSAACFLFSTSVIASLKPVKSLLKPKLTASELQPNKKTTTELNNILKPIFIFKLQQFVLTNAHHCTLAYS